MIFSPSPRILTACFVAILACSPAEEPELVGWWSAELEHAGATTDFHLRIAENRDGTLAGAISMPAIDVWDSPIGPVSIEGTTLASGLLSLHWDPLARTLSGAMPEALVPVHEIALQLRPSTAPARPARVEREIAQRLPLWQFSSGAPIWGGILHAGSSVFAGADDGRIHSLDTETGEARWSRSLGAAIRATPVVFDDALIVHSDDGALHRLARADGAIHWWADLGEPVVRLDYGSEGYRYDHAASAAAVAGDRALVGHGNRLLAVDLATGEVLWSFAADDLVTTTPVVADGIVFFGSFDGLAYAVDIADGNLVWSRDFGAPVTSSPALWESLVVIGSRSYDLAGLERSVGATIWSSYLWFSWIESSPSIRDGIAYVGSSDARLLQSFDASSGKRLWAFDTGGSAWARPAVSEKSVFLGTVGVAGYLVDHTATFWSVDRATGEPRWRHTSERSAANALWGYASSPTVGGDRVFVGTLDGRVLAFDR